MSTQHRSGASNWRATSPSSRGAHVSGKAAAGRDPYDITAVGWSTLEGRFFELMELMDTPATGINALQARATHRERVAGIIRMLLDRAQEECRKLLVDGNGEAAEEAGVKLLRLREEFFGKNHLELLPAYLHLARTKQFLERYGDAEDMLSLAHFILLKHQDAATTTMKAEMHQTFGLLYAADDKLDAAVKHLTCATYYLSAMHGPQHILTTFSYFDLGNVFAAKASMESAMALYDSVKEVWYTYLTEVVLQDIVEQKAEAEKLKKYEEENEEVEGGYASARAFGTENLADASKMLYGIFSIQKERFRVAHPSPTRAEFVLGLFLLWVEDEEEAQLHLSAARTSSQAFYGPRHPVVQEIEEWCTKFEIPYERIADEEEGDDGPPGSRASTTSADAGDAGVAPKDEAVAVTETVVADPPTAGTDEQDGKTE